MNTNPIDQKPATAGLNGTDLPNRTTQVAAFGYIFGTIKAKSENMVGQKSALLILLKTRKVNGI
jgi:hypothetical protein